MLDLTDKKKNKWHYSDKYDIDYQRKKMKT